MFGSFKRLLRTIEGVDKRCDLLQEQIHELQLHQQLLLDHLDIGVSKVPAHTRLYSRKGGAP